MFLDAINVPRWYILTYLGNHSDAEKRLAKVAMPSFAPLFFGKGDKKHSSADFQHFSNYCFIFATQNDIYHQKRQLLHSFNFLPKSNSTDQLHPYVEEYVIDQLRRILEINGGSIPFMPYPSDVIVGDTVRILTGQFEGQQATAIRKNGSKYRQIILDIAGKFIIPLCKLQIGEYEIIRYTDQPTQSGSVKVRKEDLTFLHEALQRHYRVVPVDDTRLQQDAKQIHLLLQHYLNGIPTTPLQRVKTSLLLLMAYTILDSHDNQVHYLNHTLTLIQELSSPLPLKALVYSTLYGCTFHENYSQLYRDIQKQAQGTKHEKSIAAIDPLMAKYTKWCEILYPRQTRQTITCDTTDTQWFALELQSPLADVTLYLNDADIPTFDPVVTSPAGKPIILAHSTFATLRHHQQTTALYTFVRYDRYNHAEPLYLDDTTVTNYRHVVTTLTTGLHPIPLTPDYDTLLTKSRKTLVTLNHRDIPLVVATCNTPDSDTTTPNTPATHRYILHLPHLAAIAIDPSPSFE